MAGTRSRQVLRMAVGAAAFGRRVLVNSDGVTREAISTDVQRLDDAQGESTALRGWPNLFGPTHDSVSSEPNICTQWPANGPPLVWRREIGTGYAAPVCRDDRLVVFHRQQDEELVECFDAETGQPQWSFAWPTRFTSVTSDDSKVDGPTPMGRTARP